VAALNYFIQRHSTIGRGRRPANLGSVLLYLDYTAPIDLIRQKGPKFRRPVRPQWSGKVINVQVTNTSAAAIEVRVLLSADNAAIHPTCAELREKLTAFCR